MSAVTTMAVAIVLLAYAVAAAPLVAAWLAPKLTIAAIAISGVLVVAAVGSHIVWSMQHAAPADAMKPPPVSKNGNASAAPAEMEQLARLLQSIEIECERVINAEQAPTPGEVLITCIRTKDSEERIRYLLNIQKRTVRLP